MPKEQQTKEEIKMVLTETLWNHSLSPHQKKDIFEVMEQLLSQTKNNTINECVSVLEGKKLIEVIVPGQSQERLLMKQTINQYLEDSITDIKDLAK